MNVAAAPALLQRMALTQEKNLKQGTRLGLLSLLPQLRLSDRAVSGVVSGGWEGTGAVDLKVPTWVDVLYAVLRRTVSAGCKLPKSAV